MKNILIIEDDNNLAELIGEVLKDSKYSITIISDGKEAFEYLQKKTPDFIVLDVIIPNITGIELLAHLNMNLKKDIPILFISGSSAVTKLLKEKKSKSYYFMSKPFNYKDFVDLIAHYFENSSFENFKESA